MDQDKDTLSAKVSPKKRKFYFLWYSTFCAFVAIFPLILLLVCRPIFSYYECHGNVNVVVCDGAPWLSSFAFQVFALGTWGLFFTVPAAVVLWLICLVFDVITSTIRPSK
jgi:hypothetical protein